MARLTYNMLCQSSRKRQTNQEALHQPKKQKQCSFRRDALNRASLGNKPYKRSQKISLKERGFAPIAMGPHFSLRPHTGTKGSRNRMHKKSRNRASSANELYEERKHLECIRKASLADTQDEASLANTQDEEEGSHIEANKQYEESNKASLANTQYEEEGSHIEANKQYEDKRSLVEYHENRKFGWRRGSTRRHDIPYQLGCYSPGTEPDHIPYHLYLLVKEAVPIWKRYERSKKNADLEDLTRVEKKISFFCIYFYSHLPRDWKYKRENASSLIAGCESIFAKGGPRYLMSGYTPLGDQVKEEFNTKTQLRTSRVVDLMRIVHSRKTPTPETFMEWGQPSIVFYCKLCSCFGIDYQHLETASEDDVCLMNMGS